MDSTGATSLLLNLLQISDSAFPTGSFAHSGGFEVAGQRGFIDSAGSFMTPFMREAHQQWTNPEVIRSLDCKLSASLTNHVASRASIQQGRSLIQTACATYAAPQLVSLQDQIYDEKLNGHQMTVSSTRKQPMILIFIPFSQTFTAFHGGCDVRRSVWLPGHTGDPSRHLLSFRNSSDDGRQCSAAGHDRNTRGTTNPVQTASTDPRHCGKEQGEDALHCL
ncbi:urease accessory protein UreF isoform X3 [Ixodes scapularis]|uniref:urease accessory protein UreF isoform X3 n=1 Tax=Ixodes scapularis TaxID=6945 RepID=UPI001A9DCE0F|nr:urease accessory protein UreF isoform X3 [Ixodes scapularis]